MKIVFSCFPVVGAQVYSDASKYVKPLQFCFQYLHMNKLQNVIKAGG